MGKKQMSVGHARTLEDVARISAGKLLRELIPFVGSDGHRRSIA